MHLRRMTASVAFAAGLAALPLTTANAQYYRLRARRFRCSGHSVWRALSSASPRRL